MSQAVIDHIYNTGKVAVGGVGVGGTTYATISNLDIANATAIAGLVAACMTGVYFFISAAYALWKWYIEWQATKAAGK